MDLVYDLREPYVWQILCSVTLIGKLFLFRAGLDRARDRG
jgi:hypothetical protein